MLPDLFEAWRTLPVQSVSPVSRVMHKITFVPSKRIVLTMIIQPDSAMLSYPGSGSVHTILDQPPMDGLNPAEQAMHMMQHAFAPDGILRWSLLQEIGVVRAQAAGLSGRHLKWCMQMRPQGQLMLQSAWNTILQHLPVCRRGDTLLQGLRVPYGSRSAPRIGPSGLPWTVPQDSRHAQVERMERIHQMAATLGIDVQGHLDAPLTDDA